MSDNEDKKPEEAKAADEQAAEAKPVEAKPEAKPAEAKPEAKPAEAKPAGAPALEGEEEPAKLDGKALKAAKAAKKAAAQAKAGVKPKGGKGGKKKGKGKKKGPEPFVKRTAPPRMKLRFQEEVLPAMMKDFGYTTTMAVPRLVKIVLNMGLGEALQNAKLLDSAEDELATIAGQKPVITRARKSIATYKLRQGQKIGCMVTLRRDRMYEFFDRLVTFALPRTRDFKGISPKSFDGRGNFSMGILEQIIFPEIDYDKIEKIMGLNVTIVTTARNDEEGRALLRKMGMPLRT